MDESGRRLTEEQARRIWKRAAELQARAADLASRGSLPVAAEPVEGLAPSEVTAAAVEAGIGSDYVQMALSELDAGMMEKGGDAGLQRVGRTLVGEPFDAIEAARVIPARPEEVHAAVLRIFTAPPFGLVLTDSKGGSHFVDDVLVFDAEAPSLSQTPFQSKLNMGDAKRLFVTLRSVPGRGDECRLHIRVPFERRRLNVILASLFTAGPGTVAAIIGSGIGAVLSLTGVAFVAAPVAAGLFGATAGVSVYRRIYRWTVRQARRALEQLLGAVAADIKLRQTGLETGSPAIGAGVKEP